MRSLEVITVHNAHFNLILSAFGYLSARSQQDSLKKGVIFQYYGAEKVFQAAVFVRLLFCWSILLVCDVTIALHGMGTLYQIARVTVQCRIQHFPDVDTDPKVGVPAY